MFGAVQPIKVPSVEKPITRNAKPLFQHFFSDTDDEDLVGRRKPQDNIPHRTDLVDFRKLIMKKNHHFTEKKPCISEKCIDSEDEKLQLKTIHQTIPSVMEQSLNNSSFDPSFFKHISQTT